MITPAITASRRPSTPSTFRASDSRQTALLKIAESVNWHSAGVRIGERAAAEFCSTSQRATETPHFTRNLAISSARTTR